VATQGVDLDLKGQFACQRKPPPNSVPKTQRHPKCILSPHHNALWRIRKRNFADFQTLPHQVQRRGRKLQRDHAGGAVFSFGDFAEQGGGAFWGDETHRGAPGFEAVKIRAGVLNLLDKDLNRDAYSYNEDGRRYFVAVDYKF